MHFSLGVFLNGEFLKYCLEAGGLIIRHNQGFGSGHAEFGFGLKNQFSQRRIQLPCAGS